MLSITIVYIALSAITFWLHVNWWRNDCDVDGGICAIFVFASILWPVTIWIVLALNLSDMIARAMRPHFKDGIVFKRKNR